MLGLRGWSQEKWASEMLPFGYGKAASEKKVPDPVGSEVFVLQTIVVRLIDLEPDEMTR